MSETGPAVELLWWEGCPSWQKAFAMLREELEGVGIDPGRITVTEVTDEEQAAARGFPGSPTILIGGRDVQEPGGQPVGLTCRIYRLRDGRVSPLPDRADIRDALARAAVGER